VEDEPNQRPKSAARYAGCLGPEQLEAHLEKRGSPQEREARDMHLKNCAACSTELELFRRFFLEEPTAAERADVEWIAGKLRRVSAPAHSADAESLRWWGRLGALFSNRGWAWAGATAMAMLAIAVFVGTEDHPRLPGDLGQGSTIQRSGQLVVDEPSGDVEQTPSELCVTPYSGASRYRFELREVDRTLIWSTESAKSGVDLPQEIRDLLLPGKTLVWSAQALNAAGEELASSGPQRFRVVPEPGP